jgi:Fic family protein
VTTHDELFRDSLFPDEPGNAAAKEVLRYRQALNVGFAAVREQHILTTNHIVAIQAELERNKAGFRRLPGTTLENQDGEIIYVPPDPPAIAPLMSDLERFVNEDDLFTADPLVKMALIHHRFESIHPFYDGNGRSGRIVNVLYLVKQQLLDIPVLYMSRHIIRTKTDYYRLLQAVREDDAWEDWVVYMLTAVEETAREGIATVNAIKDALFDYKHRIRAQYKFYSQDLINHLFSHPYTKIPFVEQELDVSRLTATKYLDALTEGGLLQKQRIGRSNFYVNVVLYGILTGPPMQTPIV